MRSRSQQSHRPGQSMVEFALVVPLLLLFILGIIEMGYALFVYTGVQNAAREGARAAAVLPCPSSADKTAIANATLNRIPALVDTSKITQIPSYSNGSPTAATFGDVVTITVKYPFQLLDPLTQAVIPQVNVNAVASRSITTGCGALSTPLPTSTATNTPTPNPSGTPTNTPTTNPLATDTPTTNPLATDTPTVCVKTVPNLVGSKVNSASSVWSAAGFTGGVTQSGGNGNWTIAAQSLTAGSSAPCTSSITVYDAAVTATNTPTQAGTSTPTNTAIPPTATNTQVAPTATPTTGPTATNTQVAPTATPTSGPTATPTLIPPTATPASIPPTATPTCEKKNGKC